MIKFKSKNFKLKSLEEKSCIIPWTRGVQAGLRTILKIRLGAVLFGIACMGIIFSLTGCGVQDAVVIIPAGEERNPAENVDLQAVSEEAAIEGGISAGKIQKESEAGYVYVYVCGAVVSPGVVELPEGSRAEDALQAAGGFSEDAEISYVNLAAKVADGERLYFPTVAEEAILKEQEKDEGLVNINTADLKELCTLPGIGEARAESIIAYREAKGLFEAKEDIMKVSGIKTSAYEKICDKITVN